MKQLLREFTSSPRDDLGPLPPPPSKTTSRSKQPLQRFLLVMCHPTTPRAAGTPFALAVRMVDGTQQLRGLREKGIEAASLTSSSASQASAAAVMRDILGYNSSSSSHSRACRLNEATESEEGGEMHRS